jgi:HEAT repeat protein
MQASQSDIDLVKHLRSQLTARSWGVTLEASAFVMQEHTERFECLLELLDDKNPEVSLQAAFILAHFTQNEKASDVLEKQYPKVSRELKEYILFAIGQIGAKRSLQFLTSVLDEPFESLRISAARSILLCINA